MANGTRPAAGSYGTALIAAAIVVVALEAVTGNGAISLNVPGRASAYASIAASGRFVAMAWGATAEDGTTDIYAAASRDGGRSFGIPTRVNDIAGQASLSSEQPPRVTLVPRSGQDPSVVAVWTAHATTGTRLLSARSDDGGRSFGPATVVPGSDAPGNRGWESIATDRDGRVVALWLDHREMANAGTAPMGHSAHDHALAGPEKANGVERAQLSKVFVGWLDGTESARALTGSVCYCCKTTVTTGADGSVYAAWRHVYPGNVRDIAFTVSRDAGRSFAPPIRVSDDRWVLDGCPENGPAMTVDDTGRVHIVWPTLLAGSTPDSETTLALFYATSQDGRHFTSRQRIPTEDFPSHPQIALDSRGAVVVAWDERATGIRRVVLGRGKADDNGTVRFARRVVNADGRGSHPVMAGTDEGLVVAWTSGSAGRTVVRSERVED